MAHTISGRYLMTVKPYTIIHRDALPHGVIIGISLPPDDDAAANMATEQAMTRLHSDEKKMALTHKGLRRISFVGGRIAAQAAAEGLGVKIGPVLRDPYGAPQVAEPVSISISHKRHMAIAIAARESLGSLGTDFEMLQPERAGIAERILIPAELDAVQALPADRQWTATVTRFAVKEAIYKAIAPRLRRYIRFREAEVHPHPNGEVTVHLHLAEGPNPMEIEARYCWIGEGVLATVRCRWHLQETSSAVGSARRNLGNP